MSAVTSEFVCFVLLLLFLNMGLGTEVRPSFPLPYPRLDVLRSVGIEQRGSRFLKAGAGRADVSDHHCTAVASQGILLSENHRTGLMEAMCSLRHQWPQLSASTIRGLGSGQLTLGTRVRLVPGKETPRISGSYSSRPF